MYDPNHCSKCDIAKTCKDFNKDQAKKSSGRICNDCGPPMPKDLSFLTIALLKKELTKHGKKAALVERLQSALLIDGDNSESVADENNEAPPKPKDLSALTIVLLKRELRNHGVKDLSGKKAALVERLQAALLVDNNSSETVDAKDNEVVATEDNRGPPKPKDLSALTIALLKKELIKRGVTDLSGKKAALVERLHVSLLVDSDSSEVVAAKEYEIDNENNSVVATVVTSTEQPKQKKVICTEKSTLSRPEHLDAMSLKVADLKKELKKRVVGLTFIKSLAFLRNVYLVK